MGLPWLSSDLKCMLLSSVPILPGERLLLMCLNCSLIFKIAT